MHPIRVFIDNCAWDFIFEHEIDLAMAFPKEIFVLRIIRHTEFEVAPIGAKRPELAAFIREQIKKFDIETAAYFGFYNEAHPKDEQRNRGAGGELACYEEVSFLKELNAKYLGANKRPTKLYKNEADIMLAVRSLGAIVITLDGKSGPLRDAAARGGRIIFLQDFMQSHMPFPDFVLSHSAYLDIIAKRAQQHFQ